MLRSRKEVPQGESGCFAPGIAWSSGLRDRLVLFPDAACLESAKVKDGHVHFTILSNGALLSDVPGYHTNDSLYPVGYKVSPALFPASVLCMQDEKRLRVHLISLTVHYVVLPGAPNIPVDARPFEGGRL